ncbi:DUF3142 domain-containing protein [Parerythrobacter lacustris]|uniref:DUF3142 domain-containing protein n=1 Tax=Parerythrobacter lacustris TaxID=2969984 RepID=A0ABT1XR74_9SPHN|nr:DUF3142 domain-containing protein [Parerythrobacter lacustris]MCR2833145.1 DUF3142 domain-containing protein [Parerythrobacter lacustris]
MAQAEAVYLLWGELQRGDPTRIVAMRRTVPTARTGELWLVVRADRLDWSEAAYGQLFDAARSWDRDGRLTGVQIDFDSSTGELRNYAAFLADIRNRLPRNLKLSATGLMDWPANASEADLAAMRGALDEIVIQTYAGTTTIPEYPRYLAAAKRLRMPYRVAVVEDGEWAAPEHLASDPDFRGYVVFLLAERFRRDR